MFVHAAEYGTFHLLLPQMFLKTNVQHSGSQTVPLIKYILWVILQTLYRIFPEFAIE